MSQVSVSRNGRKNLHLQARVSELAQGERGRSAIEAYQWMVDNKLFVNAEGNHSDALLAVEGLISLRKKIQKGWKPPVLAKEGEVLEAFHVFGDMLREYAAEMKEIRDDIERLAQSGFVNAQGMEQVQRLRKRAQVAVDRQQGIYYSPNITGSLVVADEEEEG